MDEFREYNGTKFNIILYGTNDEGNKNDRLTRWHGWMYARKEGACPLVNH